MTRLAIISAMPPELKSLVAGWPHSTRNGVDFWAQRNEEEEWIAACGGAGRDAGTRAFEAIEDGGPIDLVFSVGWAGALRADIATGSAHNVAGVIDVQTGERFHCEAGAGELWVATSPRVAVRAEKLRLAKAYDAALVDMEGAVVARLAAMRQIPFYAIKGVSDGLNDRLPDFNPFIGRDGHFRMISFALSAAFRPWYWPALLRMGENSKRASQSIDKTLRDFLEAQSLDA